MSAETLIAEARRRINSYDEPTTPLLIRMTAALSAMLEATPAQPQLIAEARSITPADGIPHMRALVTALADALEAALREVADALEAEQASTAADAAAPQRGPQSAHPTDLGHPQGHDAANRYAAKGQP